MMYYVDSALCAIGIEWHRVIDDASSTNTQEGGGGGLRGLKPPQIFEVLVDVCGIDDQFMLLTDSAMSSVHVVVALITHARSTSRIFWHADL